MKHLPFPPVVLVEGMEYLGCVEDMHIMTSEVEMVPVPLGPLN